MAWLVCAVWVNSAAGAAGAAAAAAAAAAASAVEQEQMFCWNLPASTFLLPTLLVVVE